MPAATDRRSTRAREFIDFAVDGAQRMTAMLDGLLYYSRAGSDALRIEAVDLNTVVADIRYDLARAIEAAAAMVSAEPLPAVTGDPVLLRQLLQNLITCTSRSWRYRARGR